MWQLRGGEKVVAGPDGTARTRRRAVYCCSHKRSTNCEAQRVTISSLDGQLLQEEFEGRHNHPPGKPKPSHELRRKAAALLRAGMRAGPLEQQLVLEHPNGMVLSKFQHILISFFPLRSGSFDERSQ